MKTVTVPVIKTDEDLQQALRSLERVFMADSGTHEADEREALALVIEAYERKHYPMEPPDCVSAIRSAMEQRQYSNADVAKVLGGASRLSEILNGRRTPSLNQIRALHAHLKIPLESLINAPGA
ncbi:MAG: helix-turn-helix domain-containing protein [Chlorobia bacterium]|nr:helix-turn-helix domain-containing protein [Fimbriimonadaceae bacterium]